MNSNSLTIFHLRSRLISLLFGIFSIAQTKFNANKFLTILLGNNTAEILLFGIRAL